MPRGLRQEPADQLADGLAFRAAGGFGLGGANDRSHVLFGSRAGLLNTGLDQRYEILGGKGRR